MPNSPKRDLLHADLTESVIGAFYRVYNRLDYGFLEAIYSESLTRVLTRKGHQVEREVSIVIYFEGEAVGLQRVDMIVDGTLVVELKSSHDLSKQSHRQLMSYLRGSEIQVGLLLHFGPRPDFYRVVTRATLVAHRPIRDRPILPGRFRATMQLIPFPPRP